MTRFVEFLEFPWLDWNPVCFTHRNSLSFCVSELCWPTWTLAQACESEKCVSVSPWDGLGESRLQKREKITVCLCFGLGLLWAREVWKRFSRSNFVCQSFTAACGKGFVSELSCRNHACRTTAEQRQLTLLASCRFQHKPSGNYLPPTPKKTGFGSKLEANIWSQNWSHFWLRLMKQ